MASAWKILIVGGALVVIGVAAPVTVIELLRKYGSRGKEVRKELHAKDTILKPLLLSRATIEQVTNALGREMIHYAGTNKLDVQRAPLSHEMRRDYESYPNLLLHYTSVSQAWLFFDSEGRLQKYHLREQ